jgi:hypothetical protein
MVLAGLCVTVLAAPTAMAAPVSGPALMTRGGGPAAPGWHKAVIGGSAHGMPGWQIALIALAAAFVIAVGDRALTRARAARRAVPGTG